MILLSEPPSAHAVAGGVNQGLAFMGCVAYSL